MNSTFNKNLFLDDYLTPRDIAGPLRLPVSRVRELLKRNPDIAFIQFGRSIRIPAASVATLLGRYGEGGSGGMASPNSQGVPKSRTDAGGHLRRARRDETKSVRRLTDLAVEFMTGRPRKR